MSRHESSQCFGRVLCGLAAACVLAAHAATAQMLAAHEGRSPGLPASGQTKSYPAERDGRAEHAIPADAHAIPDDGQVRAGSPLRYRDNGDGTLTDLSTGLVWEKKCSGCDGLHDVHKRLRWSADGKEQTAWDWLAALNAEGERGFAGYSDWRIPNLNELVSILDYGNVLPSVSKNFQGEQCTSRCSDLKEPRCSCTEPGEYWTSTTFADFPAHAFVVYFGMGLVNDRLKTALQYVRAVRGGSNASSIAGARPIVTSSLPATGQATSYSAVTAEGTRGAEGVRGVRAHNMVAVPDDGRLQAGRLAAFRDNGDGTISDLRTGLMWEKKCDGCGGLHDSSLQLRWSGAENVWEWQQSLNREGGKGFAGYSDWRIPNVKELQSIVDYERFNPAVGRTFDGNLCGLGCASLEDPQCSCTRLSRYWSSTTFPGRTSHAIIVAFNLGLIEPRLKHEYAAVRAVRAGSRLER